MLALRVEASLKIGSGENNEGSRLSHVAAGILDRDVEAATPAGPTNLAACG